MRQGFKFENPNEKSGCGCGHVVQRLTRRSRAWIRLLRSSGTSSRAAFDVDLAAVEKTHRELSRALHPDRYVGGERERAAGGARQGGRGQRGVARRARPDPARRGAARARAASASARTRRAEGRSRVPDGDARAARGARGGQAGEGSRSRASRWRVAIEERARGASSARWPRASREARRRRSSARSASCGSTGASSTR